MAGQDESGHFPAAKVCVIPPFIFALLTSLIQYPQYIPDWTPSHPYPLPEPFEHYERAKDADSTFPNLSSSAHIKHLTPFTGSVVTGVQLSNLTPQARDELALLVAQRKVVIFRSQDFRDLPIPSVIEFCKYFGPLYIFEKGPYLPDCPEIHIAHNSDDDTRLRDSHSLRTTSMSWHIDGSADSQPPGLVFLYMLECPDLGGDTVFTNTAEAYKKLSPSFAERLHGLKAEHKLRTGFASIHPVVRTHPVTGEKCLFVNPICASLSTASCPLLIHSFMLDIGTYQTQILRTSSVSRKRKATHCSVFSSSILSTLKTVRSAFNGLRIQSLSSM